VKYVKTICRSCHGGCGVIAHVKSGKVVKVEGDPDSPISHGSMCAKGLAVTEVPGVEIQIRDENGNVLEPNNAGEVCVRGPNIMKGYYNNIEGTREAFWPGGWFRSGDVGVLDENGYLFIGDRLKDMIISGGENVYSLEVEEVLYAHPDVQECAVIGTLDKEWGERVTAFILPKPGQTIDQRELKDFLKARLSAYKVPKRFFMVGDFPRSPAGKLLKRKLRESFLKGDDSA